jgi:hypothetical protein
LALKNIKLQNRLEKEIYYFNVTNRELGICPWADFSFVPGIFTPGTNEDICTGWSHRPEQMSSQARRVSSPPDTNASHLYRVVALSGTNVLASHLYRVVASPGINVVTFVPGKKKTSTNVIPSMGGA